MKTWIGLSVAAFLLCAMQAPPTAAVTLYIMPDGSGDAPTVQVGLDMCAAGDTVLVAAGTYNENIVWPDMDGLKLMSESGPEVTAIDGGGTDRVILIMTGVDETTVIDGFAIRNAQINGTGAGIMCAYGSSPTISNNDIYENTAGMSGSGGGIGCDASSPTIINNSITHNSAAGFGGGIGCSSGSSPIIMDNTITHNIITVFGYTGGCGIGADASSPTIINNTIAGNGVGTGNGGGGGGGINIAYGSSATITGNTITGNTTFSGGGIMIWEDCTGTISDNIITDNTADQVGGGICTVSSSTTITGNTISGNIAHGDNAGGGILCSAGDMSMITYNAITGNEAISGEGSGIQCSDNAVPTIMNCTISENIGHGIFCKTGSNPLINYNNIRDNTGYGVRNIDPSVIVDATTNWWGDSSGPYHPAQNPGGLGDEVSDYVLFFPWSPVGVESQVSPVRIVLQQNYPNPFNPRTTLRFTLSQGGPVQLSIFDLEGRLVCKPVNQDFGVGSHSVVWDGLDERGQSVASGPYFVRLESLDVTDTRKIMLLR